MIKKIFLASTLMIGALPASASDIQAKLEGMLNFLGVARSEKDIPDDNSLTGNQKNTALDTSAYFAVTALNKSDDTEYGAKLVLQTTAFGSGSPSHEGSHIFLINEDLGKVELGSGFDAATQMRITGLDVARGTGDGWSDYAYFVNDMYVLPSPYGFFLGSSFFKKDNVESSRKFTYFTPKISGFRFGISYIPDTGNIGSMAMSDGKYTKEKARKIEFNGYRYTEKVESKNAVSLGATFENNFADDVDIKLSVTGEFGKAGQGEKQQIDAENKVVENSTIEKYKLSDMRTYNIGGILTYGNFAYAGSFGDVKGFTSKEVDGTKRNTRFYSTAIAYTQGPVGVSLSYLLTNTRKNKVDAITIGTDYKLAPGLVPYAEVTYFKGRGHRLPIFNDTSKYNHKGTVGLIGMKLKF